MKFFSSIIFLLSLTIPTSSALEYNYLVDIYSNHFYTSTSSNCALDIDSADDSGGASIIIPSEQHEHRADNTAPRDGSPVFLLVIHCTRGVWLSSSRSTQMKS